MTIVDIEALLQEIDAAAPCGPDLEYAPDFLALEQAILGKPEVQYGDTITQAVPPDWKVVKKLASGLLARSRDDLPFGDEALDGRDHCGLVSSLRRGRIVHLRRSESRSHADDSSDQT